MTSRKQKLLAAVLFGWAAGAYWIAAASRVVPGLLDGLRTPSPVWFGVLTVLAGMAAGAHNAPDLRRVRTRRRGLKVGAWASVHGFAFALVPMVLLAVWPFGAGAAGVIVFAVGLFYAALVGIAFAIVALPFGAAAGWLCVVLENASSRTE